MSEHRPTRPAQLSYRDAGVDIDAGNEAVRRIRSLAQKVRAPGQLDDIGGFAGMMALPDGLQNAALVSCADGVGTKLLVAIALDRHDTIGIDAVAMNVNDLVCTGARPLFVLDYIACDRLVPTIIEQIVAGVVAGCRASGCALLGGETAELPDLYPTGHYDVAAFAVGLVDRDRTLGSQRVRAGDVVLALPSSGLHSNGYSLARKALLAPEHLGLQLDAPLPDAPQVTVGQALLEPTRIYVQPIVALLGLEGEPLHAAVHITGGGLIENPPRVLPDTLECALQLGSVPVPPVFAAIERAGVGRAEMLRTFNCGVGMLLVVDRERVAEVANSLRAHEIEPIEVGLIRPRTASAAVKIED